MREAYRQNKELLYDFLSKAGKQYALAIVFTGTSPAPYEELEGKIILSLQRLVSRDNEGIK